MIFVALAPILWLIAALTVMKMSAAKACSLALLFTLVIGLTMYDMTLLHGVEAVLEGVALACWPILLTIIAAIFTYNLTLHTRSMDTIKGMLTSVSCDKRVLVLLIGWGFGGFLEGMAGFGTAIAIPAGMLVGIGIKPVRAAAVCLIANSVPTAYGSIGIPLVTLGSVTNVNAVQLATFTCIQLLPFIIMCPILMVIVTGKSIQALKGVAIMAVGAGLSFLLPELVISLTMGPELAVVAGSICTMAFIVACAKLMPAHDAEYELTVTATEPVAWKKGLIAWLPFILIFLLLLATSKLVPVINVPLNAIKSSVLIYDGPGGAPYTFTWVATPGIMILLSAFIGGYVQKAGFGEMLGVLKQTIIDLRFTVVTIITVIATAKVMGYAGMTHEIAETAVAFTGNGYPAVAAFIGSVGTFITGSATSSCVLFGQLQVDSAVAIGADPNTQVWIDAANATGACAGKMVSPQSIAIAVAAIGASGAYGQLLKFAVRYYVPFVIAMGLIVYFGQPLVR